ncbi:hypothetical protein C0Q70_03188 [Pomacea canaliculata]|uniref:Uncharacterized protein n=1 Tax=Pomacea canaliculata TaxID=400727 RepID=A0A2T7PS10_POMCA|nr:hypothetical protein C0Q70_03188 [Pomacea canaliculata]
MYIAPTLTIPALCHAPLQISNRARAVQALPRHQTLPNPFSRCRCTALPRDRYNTLEDLLQLADEYECPAAGLGKDRPQDGRIPREGCKDLEEGASRRAVRRDDDVVVSKKVWKGAKGKLFNQLLANPIPFLAQVPESIMEYVRAG